MNATSTLTEYLSRLRAQGVHAGVAETERLAPAHRLPVNGADWGVAAQVGAELNWRWAGIWGDPMPESCVVRACLVSYGDYLVLETEVPYTAPLLASHTPWYPGADRMERHMQDLLGIRFADHPRDQRWTRHQAWSAEEYPLRPEFPVNGQAPVRAPADTDYPFVAVKGSGVYEIPVGPVHAGIIEPGHFRFQAVGEEILSLEERLGYVHKGIEKLAVGREPEELARLAGRVSGDSTVAHTWAACQAMEHAADYDVPPRALHLRALLAERERVANHIGDVGAICNDVGFAFAHMQCARLREQWQRRSHELFGHRLLMDVVVPGGVARDLPGDVAQSLRADHRGLREAVAPIFEIVDDHPPLEDRLLGTGRLNRDDAGALGCTGYVAKGSGLDFDLRRDAPYAPYDRLRVDVPVLEQGDVTARVQVRMQEVLASLALMDELLESLPGGKVAASLPPVTPGAAGIGLIEGWRGEILSFVRFDDTGHIARFFPRDPSWFLWPALERLIDRNIVPDFPVCNKSVNGSYSGHDL
ncbi:hydrogenase large subunit [Arhodomonas sp. SL1]|uniref:hydrogenase large subunit n=1 Tax=Arhodomonas sp. SL1 TaxID=3425691 RepID=UPI003F883D38